MKKRTRRAIAKRPPAPVRALVQRHRRSQFPREIHWRYLAAYVGDLGNKRNGIPRDGVIAKELGIARETIVRWRRRYPEFSKWVHEQVAAQSGDLGPSVMLDTARRALKGSGYHAELYFKATGRIGPGTAAVAAGPPVVNIHIGVPDPVPLDQWKGGYVEAVKK